MVITRPASETLSAALLGGILVLAWLWVGPAKGAEGLSPLASSTTLDLALPDLDGTPRTLGDFAEKVLLVNFWASWCRPCLEEMPSIRRLSQALADRPFAVIAVNVGETRRRADHWAEQLGMDVPVLLDQDATVFRRWGGKILPTTYVLDATGRVVDVVQGPLEWDRAEVIDSLNRILDGGTSPER